MRDIDDWMFHFERRAAPGLKKIFGEDLGELPMRLRLLLEKLRVTEASRDPKNERRNARED
ncbi:MAG: hypothetical protein JSR99_10085 [Proteobacteria bacterium]|nr:hypothetical protein [Pseudomonadota bacterium]